MADKDLVFRKSYKCPICDSNFKNLTVKQGKAYRDSADFDLKVNFKNIEPLKYDIIMCPVCGYGALERYFERVAPRQRKDIIDKLCQTYVGIDDNKDEYTFDDAIERYDNAFVCADIKNSKNSEIGFMSLKLAWLYRAYSKSLPLEDEKKDELWQKERAYLFKAMDNLEVARLKEHSPICGMDDVTLDILLAGLCIELEELDTARKYINSAMNNRNVSVGIRNKIYEFKSTLKRIEDEAQAENE